MIGKELDNIKKKVNKIEKERKQYLDLLVYCRTELEKLGWCEDIQWDNNLHKSSIIPKSNVGRGVLMSRPMLYKLYQNWSRDDLVNVIYELQERLIKLEGRVASVEKTISKLSEESKS